MGLGEETSIKQLINHIANDGQISIGILEGVVSNVSPIKISLINDAKMVLTSIDLVIPGRLGNSLSRGTKVYLLVYNNGKKFYVLDIV